MILARQLRVSRSLAAAEDGTALIEFALIFPLLVLLVIGTVDYAFFFEQQMTLTHAAAAGAAYGTLAGKSLDAAGMQSTALAAISTLQNISANASSFWTCTPSGPHLDRYTLCSDGNTARQWVEVDLSATMPALFAFPGLPSGLALRASVINPVPWNP